MQTWFRAACAALLITLPAIVQAQGQSTVQLGDPSPPAWDASGHMSWLTVDKTGIAPEWNRWYDVATVGGSLSRFLGPHLKVEFDATTSASAEVYVTQEVRVPTQSYPIYVSQPQRFQMTTLAGGVSYQFFDNRWFHPVVGAGVQSARERRTIERALYPVPLPASVIVDQPGTSSSWSTRPYADVGFKWFVSERAFVRSSVRTTFDSGGVTHVSWRSGFGFDF
jgi:hypothetical protein